MSLPVVRKQWERIIFMQTNREDVGDRFLEIQIPLPKSRDIADSISKPYKTYYDSIINLDKEFAKEREEVLSRYK